MSLTAADVMQTHVITVSPADPLDAVKRLFFEEEIHGAPVVDEDGRVRGMITSMDLIRAAMEESEDGGANFTVSLEELGLHWGESSEGFASRLGESVVEDVMSGDVVTVTADTPVSEVARLLRENKIHRVLVVKEESLMGIVSSFDLIRVLEQVDDTK